MPGEVPDSVSGQHHHPRLAIKLAGRQQSHLFLKQQL